MFSRLPSSSIWLSPTLVMSPQSGRTNLHSSAIWPKPRMPISTTTTSVSGSAARSVRGTPSSLFWLAFVATTEKPAATTSRTRFFVVVLPGRPREPDHAAAQMAAPAPREIGHGARRVGHLDDGGAELFGEHENRGVEALSHERATSARPQRSPHVVMSVDALAGKGDVEPTLLDFARVPGDAADQLGGVDRLHDELAACVGGDLLGIQTQGYSPSFASAERLSSSAATTRSSKERTSSPTS